MKRFKKLIALMLCVCMSGYTLPAFAIQTDTDDEVNVKISTLTDSQMNALVGAGSVDATVSDYPAPGENASAVIANRSSSLSMPYSLVGMSINRDIIETIASGNLPPNTAVVVNGPVTSTSTYVIQARIGGNGIKALESIDAAMQ